MGVETRAKGSMSMSLKIFKVYFCSHKMNSFVGTLQLEVLTSPRFFSLKLLQAL